MDKNFLVSLNNIQYSDEELKEMEKLASSEKIDIDKYYIRNSKLKKRLAIDAIEKGLKKELLQDESIEKTIFAESGLSANNYIAPNIMTWGAPIYYYAAITNKRLITFGLDYEYKCVNSYFENLTNIDGVVEEWETHNFCGVTFNDTTILLCSKENKSELNEFISLLKSHGIKQVKYNDIFTGHEKTWVIWLMILVGLPLILFLLRDLFLK